MKMTKKKTTLLALFAVSVIALAGVGYATLGQYVAVTVNNANDAHSAYITASQNNYTGGFDGTVDVYTYSDANFEYIYALPGSESLGTISQIAYYGVSIGNGITITVADHQTGLNTIQYTIAADITSANALPTGWTYILVYGGTAKAVVNNNGSADAIVVTPGNGGAITVDLYIAGPAFSTMLTTGQSPVGPLVTPSGWANYGASTTYTGANNGEIYASANFVFTVTAAEAPAQQL